MYNINSEATVTVFIDLQKCELETELEVLYLNKGLQKTAGDTPWLHFPFKKNHTIVFSEIVTSLTIAGTLPVTTVERERCFFTLNWIKTFFQNRQTDYFSNVVNHKTHCHLNT